ncbi:MAG: hypothetical protein J6X83_00650 [Methanomicrobium sp.]|nr:hypothetical protein [Methanomicrobium sp.]
MTKKVAIPPMISDTIASGIAELDGFLFDAADRCPYCGGELRSHDIKQKVFARIDTDMIKGINGSAVIDATADGNGSGYDKGDGGTDRGRNISVKVRRRRCTACGKLVYSKSPFYDGIRTGAPIADFCMVNRDLHPPNHIAKILGKLGIIVTPATVRNILQSDIPELSNPENIPSVNIYGIIFPSSLLNISERIRRGR